MKLRTPDNDELTQLTRVFAQHSDPAKVQLHNSARHLCRDTALSILQTTPPSRERSVALTKLEEVMFWWNAAIARNG